MQKIGTQRSLSSRSWVLPAFLVYFWLQIHFLTIKYSRKLQKNKLSFLSHNWPNIAVKYERVKQPHAERIVAQFERKHGNPVAGPSFIQHFSTLLFRTGHTFSCPVMGAFAHTTGSPSVAVRGEDPKGDHRRQ